MSNVEFLVLMMLRDNWFGIALWSELRGHVTEASTATRFANVFAQMEARK